MIWQHKLKCQTDLLRLVNEVFLPGVQVTALRVQPLFLTMLFSMFSRHMTMFLTLLFSVFSSHMTMTLFLTLFFSARCPRDDTFSTHVSGSRSYARFSFQAFKFLRAHPSVYLQCKVLICPANDYNSRCRQGCRTRKTRSLGSQHQMAIMVLGPITLKG